MKLRSRLLIAFLIITILPLCLTVCCVNLILERQHEYCQENYNISKSSFNNLEAIVNPLNFFYQLTLTEYEKLEAAIEENPDKFLDISYVKKFDQALKKNSHLVVLKEEKTIYINDIVEDLVTLPINTSHDNASSNLILFDEKGTCIIKEKTFTFCDGMPGRLLLISDFTGIHNEWINSLKAISLTLCIIFLVTNGLLAIWIYQSIVRPLHILRLATTQIGNGILSKAIPVTSNDEIGELCTDFDNMRIRLKEIINRQLHTEENLQEILSSLSHDLKTPITAIKGYTEGLLDGVADTDEKKQRYLQTIYAKSNDISYLIDELAIYTKIEQNVLAYNFIPINLEEYFKDCIDYFKLDLEQDNFSIDYYNSTDFSTMVVVDPQQLRRVIQNIIHNAVKYNDKEHGHIYVRIENMPDRTNRPIFRQINEEGTDIYPGSICKSFVRVEIEDNGPGIPAKDLPHIFDKFYRADTSRNSSKGGSGLGLSIVKMIIYDHGGEVGADSIEGTGTRFYFTLKKITKEED